jgi:hypothetical protein
VKWDPIWVLLFVIVLGVVTVGQVMVAKDQLRDSCEERGGVLIAQHCVDSEVLLP